MKNINVVDVLCEYQDRALIYKCTVNRTTKLAKYAGMKLWLEEKGATGMVKMLKGLHEFLEEPPRPMRRSFPRDKGNSVSTLRFTTKYINDE